MIPHMFGNSAEAIAFKKEMPTRVVQSVPRRRSVRAVLVALGNVLGPTPILVGMVMGTVASFVGMCIAAFMILIGIVYGLIGPLYPSFRTIETINLVLAVLAVAFTGTICIGILVRAGPRGIVQYIRQEVAEINAEINAQTKK